MAAAAQTRALKKLLGSDFPDTWVRVFSDDLCMVGLTCAPNNIRERQGKLIELLTKSGYEVTTLPPRVGSGPDGIHDCIEVRPAASRVAPSPINNEEAHD